MRSRNSDSHLTIDSIEMQHGHGHTHQTSHAIAVHVAGDRAAGVRPAYVCAVGARAAARRASAVFLLTASLIVMRMPSSFAQATSATTTSTPSSSTAGSATAASAQASSTQPASAARAPIAADAPKQLVAHRGASAYAPEHTLASYRLALAQGADFVEQDLALTKDGVLICLHDTTLERTTDVATVFPDRFVEEGEGATRVRHWYANDFTLAEIKRLDAGRWFDAKFAGERVPTFQEAIDLVRGKAGLYPELKDPELYRRRGTSIVPPVLAALQKNGLDRPHAAGTRPALILQSFDEETLRELAARLPVVPRVFLMGGRPFAAGGASAHWLASEAAMREMAAFATGIGPAKDLVLANPAIVGWAHAAGLTVTPYTFREARGAQPAQAASGQAAASAAASAKRTSDSAATGATTGPANAAAGRSVTEEMRYFLYTLGVDAVFTDNPDRFPRR